MNYNWIFTLLMSCVMVFTWMASQQWEDADSFGSFLFFIALASVIAITILVWKGQ